MDDDGEVFLLLDTYKKTRKKMQFNRKFANFEL